MEGRVSLGCIMILGQPGLHRDGVSKVNKHKKTSTRTHPPTPGTTQNNNKKNVESKEMKAPAAVLGEKGGKSFLTPY